jgi:hypothetical protein
LRGVAKTIKRFRPFILFDVHRTFDDEDEIRALNMLKGLGYGFCSCKAGVQVYAYPMERGCLCYEQA